MTKKLDPDFKAIKHAHKALIGSTSHRMLKANIKFLVDYFLEHPSSALPKRLQDD